MASTPSDKSRGVTLALSVFLGVFGAHRFYTGKVGTGLLMLCTLGGFGIWYVYDVILVASGGFRDAEGRLVTKWDAEEAAKAATSGIPSELLDEIDALRTEVAELAERLDFAERLLADPSRRVSDPARSAPPPGR